MGVTPEEVIDRVLSEIQENLPDIMRLGEISQFLKPPFKASKQYIYKLHADGKIEGGLKMGKEVHFTREEVMAWLHTRYGKPIKKPRYNPDDPNDLPI